MNFKQTIIKAEKNKEKEPKPRVRFRFLLAEKARFELALQLIAVLTP